MRTALTFRFWLLKLLAGKSTIILNAEFKKNHLKLGPGEHLVCNSKFDRFGVKA